MDRNWNLLFGLLALQTNKVEAARLAEAASAWSADPSQDLPERLAASGALGEHDRTALAGFADFAVQSHGGDSSAALASFGGEAQFQRLLLGRPEGVMGSIFSPKAPFAALPYAAVAGGILILAVVVVGLMASAYFRVARERRPAAVDPGFLPLATNESEMPVAR